MKQNCDVLIIGQGIAGSCLAYCLLQQGFDVQIITSHTKPNASKIAGGLMQRVSGQYLSLPKLIQDHFDEAVSFYQSLNTFFDAPIISSFPTYRILDESQLNIWKKKRTLEPYKDYLGQHLQSITVQGKTTHVGVDIYDSYSVNTALLLSLFSKYFLEKKILSYHDLTEKDLIIHDNAVQCNTIKANFAIFCIGSCLTEWSLFNDFPLINSKGDMLSLTLNQPENRILQYDKWLIPIDHNHFKFGSTYSIDPTISPTQSAYNNLLSSLSFLGYNDITIQAIHTAHRCTFSDYKPSMGFLNHSPRIGIFSGFSSKGFITAPSLAKQWSVLFPNLPNQSLLINRFTNS